MKNSVMKHEKNKYYELQYVCTRGTWLIWWNHSNSRYDQLWEHQLQVNFYYESITFTTYCCPYDKKNKFIIKNWEKCF